MSTEDIRIDEEAADWLMRQETGIEDPHDDFGAWLEQSPKHLARYLRVYGMFRRLDGIDPDKRIDVDALAGNRVANVVQGAFGWVRPAANSVRQKPKHRAFLRPWAAAAVLAVLAVGAVLLSGRHSGTASYETAVGEQRFVKLPDGSTVHLNTRSRIDVEFSTAGRRVRLIAGEALFTVAPDSVRPFDVSDGHATFRALGTQFNLYKRNGHTRLTVTEGVVQVDPVSAGRPAAALPHVKAGEQIEVAAGGQVLKTATPDIARSVAWPQRTLVFRDTALPEVVAEFNRYNELQLRLDSERLRIRRISGIFGADHPESLLKYLEQNSGIEVVPAGNERVIRDRP